MYRKKSWLRRTAMCLGALTAVAAALLVASPAHADASSYPLPGQQVGHTCRATQKLYDSLLQTYFNGVFCIEVAIYTSAATGQQFVTAQAEGYCQDQTSLTTTPVEPCVFIDVDAGIANGSGDVQSGFKSCNGPPSCSYARSYFFPFGGFPISPGHCDSNVWGVLFGDSWVKVQDEATSPLLTGNFATPHYTVCEDFAGRFTFAH